MDDRTIQTKLEALIQLGKGHPSHFILEILVTALGLLRDQVEDHDIKIIHHALKEMRYGYKLFRPYREVRKVSVFGSARTEPTDPLYAHSALFSKRMTESGFMVITGAGEGIMRAAQSGAGRTHSFGMNITLPFEQAVNEFIEDDPKLMTFKYFFTRKLFFIKEANAIALFPGGFGTHDEGFEVLTLLQTGKIAPLPIVFINEPGGDNWGTFRNYLEGTLLAKGLISPEDIHLFKITDSIDTAVHEITHFYHNYHSLYSIDGQSVIRLQHPISSEMLQQVNDQFTDILEDGRFTEGAALPGEPDVNGNPPLYRIVFHFNKRNFGRLHQLIHLMNGY